MPTRYKTINLSPDTYERLSLYKVGQSTFDETIRGFMAEIEPEAFYRELLKTHRKRRARMEQEGGIALAEAEAMIEEA